MPVIIDEVTAQVTPPEETRRGDGEPSGAPAPGREELLRRERELLASLHQRASRLRAD